MKLSELKPSDKGREVRYTSSHGDKIEFGRITSWNDKFVFVRYHWQARPERRPRFGDTSEATDPVDLEFTQSKGSEGGKS